MSKLDFSKLTLPERSEILNDKKKRLLLTGVIVLTLTSLAFGVWSYLDDSGFFDDLTSSPVRPAPLPDPIHQELPQVPAKEKNDAPPTPVQLHSSSASRLLSDLLAQKQLKAAELAVKELDKKLLELNPVPAPVPAIIPAAQAILSNPELLPKIRSIKGLDGRLKAVLSTGGTVKTVKSGDSFQCGTVERITSGGVEFRGSDGTIHTLAFEE